MLQNIRLAAHARQSKAAKSDQEPAHSLDSYLLLSVLKRAIKQLEEYVTCRQGRFIWTERSAVFLGSQLPFPEQSIQNQSKVLQKYYNMLQNGRQTDPEVDVLEHVDSDVILVRPVARLGGDDESALARGDRVGCGDLFHVRLDREVRVRARAALGALRNPRKG